MMEEQKVENKYARGKIYKIVGGGLTYYGSTCEKTLAMRLGKHRASYNFFKSGKGNNMSTYKIFDICNDYDIILVENSPCNSKDELHARERFYIENNECVNKYIPNRTIKEYVKDHKVHIQQQQRDYYINNKQETLKIITCSCGKTYTQTHKMRHFKSKFHIKNS